MKLKWKQDKTQPCSDQELFVEANTEFLFLCVNKACQKYQINARNLTGVIITWDKAWADPTQSPVMNKLQISLKWHHHLHLLYFFSLQRQTGVHKMTNTTLKLSHLCDKILFPVPITFALVTADWNGVYLFLKKWSCIMCLYLHALLTTQESFHLESLASSTIQCYNNMLNYFLYLTEFVVKNCYSDYCLHPAHLRFGACNCELEQCIKILIGKAALLFFQYSCGSGKLG